MIPPPKPKIIAACLTASIAVAVLAAGLALLTRNPLALWLAAPLLPIGGMALALRRRGDAEGSAPPEAS